MNEINEKFNEKTKSFQSLQNKYDGLKKKTITVSSLTQTIKKSSPIKEKKQIYQIEPIKPVNTKNIPIIKNSTMISTNLCTAGI